MRFDDRRLGARPVVVASLSAERAALVGETSDGHVPLVPMGICHGVPLGDQVTLCGLATIALSLFPGLPLAAATFLRRCDACVERLDEAGA